MHTQDGAYPRRCTHKAVYSHRKSHVIEGGVRGLAPASSVASRSVGKVGSCTWNSTRFVIRGKMVHTQGGTHRRRSIATAGFMLLKGSAGAGPRVKHREP